MSNNITYRMINQLVEESSINLAKMKKSEILAFTKQLMTDYYYELDNDTIKEIYNGSR